MNTELRLAKIELKKIETVQHGETLRAFFHDYEPLIAIVLGAAGLGFLENERIGNYQLISTWQKRALLAGLLAVEIARSGLVQQVGEATSETIGAVTKGTSDIAGVIAPLLGAM